MSNDFKYILQPYKGLNSRTTCPACQKKNQFARYLDQQTNEPLADNVGRCNREVNCSYHYTPKQYFEDNNIQPIQNKTFTPSPKPEPEPVKQTFSNIPFDILRRTRKAYDQNNFTQFLFDKLGKETALQVLILYHIGTSKHWPGATVFWQIDILGKVRAGKIMLYDKETGHRVKKPYPHITWIHKLINIKDYQLNQCLFGEHLLTLYPDKPAAIVESEKTAILAAAYQPAFNWLAAGNLNNLSRERCKPLKGKTVLLFPDAGAYQIWNKKAKDLKDLTNFIVSDLIEQHATPEQIEKGFDLADYFEGQPKTMFTGRKEFEQTPDNKITEEIILPGIIKEIQKPIEQEPSAADVKLLFNQEALAIHQPTEIWPIEELEEYFLKTPIPEGPIKLSNSINILDPKTFIQNHLATIKENNGKETFKSYFDRLVSLKNFLSNNL